MEIKLSDFLNNDDIIKTSLEKSNDWIQNIAYKVYSDSNELEIAFDDRYLSSLVMVGDKMKITKTMDGYEYIVDAIIIQIRIEPTRTMLLRVENIIKVQNLRKDERYSVNYATTIQSFSELDGVFGVVVNISISGLAFVCKQNFVVGEVVRLSIMLPSSTFVIDAEIMRVSDSNVGSEYGVRFLRTDDAAIRDVESLIENIKEREDRLSRIVGFNII
jgi:hypothetical protein